jgi:DNA-binding NarL/FixJ family response regulator
MIRETFKLTCTRDHRTGRFLKAGPEPAPKLAVARRFSCVFLSTSVQDASSLNQKLATAGIRAYHASDAREAEILLAITAAKILLIDIDRTFEPWLELLEKLDEKHPHVPKIVLTAVDPQLWQLILSRFALDVVPKPAHLGDLFGALECAHWLELEINDPKRTRERSARVLQAIREAALPGASHRSLWHSIRARLSAIMVKVTHVRWKFERHRTREQHSHS